ncbi:MAG: SDR family NAD(P)-dependent oxidoreductase, partial [Moraxellaceae bacterium]|nr:SDR family NAD(P)-dependent oxidoreductase [Moraxellaceae bacterium]MBP9731783.1 SDR family NAD(P)-dependent oxidoreductase [Moraxellaceae bacterium]
MTRQVFIIGGASGIGEGLARLYAQGGDSISVFDRAPADEVLAGLRQLAENPAQTFTGYQVDVTNADGVAEVMRRASALTSPDVVIHCAGIVASVPFESLPVADFTRVVNVNLIGTANVAAAVLPHLKSGSQLVLMASMAGLVGCYGYSAYTASKFGVVGLAEVLRMELKAREISVSVVCPPEVETPMVVQERLERSHKTEVMKLIAGSLPRDEACSQIKAGIDARQFMVIPGRKARLVRVASRLLPAGL